MVQKDAPDKIEHTWREVQSSNGCPSHTASYWGSVTKVLGVLKVYTVHVTGTKSPGAEQGAEAAAGAVADTEKSFLTLGSFAHSQAPNPTNPLHC